MAIMVIIVWGTAALRSVPRYVWPCVVVALVATWPQGASTRAQPAELIRRDVVFNIDSKAVSVKAYLPSAPHTRAAAILLHGRGGFDALRDGYERYGASLAVAGIAAYLLSYYDDLDDEVMSLPDRQRRQTHFREQIGKWAKRVNQFAADLLAQAEPPKSLAVVGFSNGGFVATAAAGNSNRFKALVVMYGGLPDWLPDPIKSLPPTLVIHGEADRVTPITDGTKLAEFAIRLGVQTELVCVRDADHGFDLAKDDAQSVDARRHVVEFLATRME